MGSGVATLGNSSVFNYTSLSYLNYNCPADVPGAISPKDGLTTVIIGDSVTYIGAYAFNGASSLPAVTLPAAVDSIGDYAFQSCSAMATINIPDAVTTIGHHAFNNCRALTSIAIPEGVTAIREYTFNHCDSLASATLPESLTSIGYQAFQNCSTLTSIVIPDAVTSIGGYAFYQSGLDSLTVGSGVATLGNSSVFHYTSLSYLNYNCPADVPGAISPRNRLSTVVVGDAVSSIANNAFNNCSALDTVYMRPVIPPALGTNTFTNNAAGRVFIVNGCSFGDYYTSNPANPWYAYRNDLRRQVIDIAFSVLPNDTARGTVAIVQQSGYDIHCDSTTIITATANYGYHFAQWNNGSTANPDTLALVADSTVTALFLPNIYAITGMTNDSTRGTVAGSDSVPYLASVNLIAQPAVGYHLDQWTYTNEADNTVGTRNGGDTLTLVATHDRNATAFFTINQYFFDVTANDTTMGTVSGGGIYNHGAAVTLAATPATGHHFVQWSDGVSDNPRTVTALADAQYTATFAINTYLIGVTANDTAMGTVSGGGTYNHGGTVTLTATAAAGHHFVQWSDGETANPRTVSATADAQYTALFAINTYTIGVTANDTAMGTVSGGGIYNHGTAVTLAATPAIGHHFVQWSDGVSDNPRTVIALADAQYIATFAINTYLISVTTNDTTMGTVSGGGTYSHGSTVTLGATPNYGYHFVQWGDGETDNPRTVSATADAQYTAFFAINQYTVAAISADTTMGAVSGTATVDYLTPVTLTAVAHCGYAFDHWSNGETTEQITVTATADTTLTAYFDYFGHDTVYIYIHDTVYIHDTIFVGVDVVETIDAKVYVSRGQVVVEGADGNTVTLYDLNGRMLATKQDYGTALRFDVPATGTYMVRIGNYPARRVVVIR